jgi:phosphatidylserine decarboxylase
MVPRALEGRIAGPGPRLSLILAVAAIVLLPLSGSLAAVLLLLSAANLAFFRNPNRRIPEGQSCAVAPADGRVVEVTKIDDPGQFVGPAWRIAIFLSVFNVHVQRAPLSGKVRAVRQSGTRFLAAFNSDASHRNVQTRLDLETDSGARFSVVQITGLIARRIFCYPRAGDDLVRGEPYGLICYGSRVELYLPESATIRVSPGDRVRGGATVVAEVES